MIANESMNTRKPKIAMFLPGLYGGGAERIFINLAKGFSQKGHSIDFVLSQAEGPYIAELPDFPESIRVIVLNQRQRNTSRTLSSLPALVRYLRKEKPAVLLTGLHANIIAILARKIAGVSTRIVISEHNTFSYQNQLLPGLYQRLMVTLVRVFYPWADKIIAVSQGAADDLSKVARINKNRILTIYNPIITPELKEKSEAPNDHPWFNLGEPPVIISIGRLSEQKDFQTLIHAFAYVRQSHPARLIILGEGEQRRLLESLIRQLDLEREVSLPGFVSNPYSFLRQSALFVLCSQWEGLPTVLVEALFCSVPIVATDCPSGPREILRDGCYGQLVPVGDSTELANAILASLDGKSIHPPAESWQAFELETVVDQYLQILLNN